MAGAAGRLLGGLAAALLALAPLSPAQAAPRKDAFRHEPMIFHVATGEADACGPGCDTWIAAEGTFDPEVARRLNTFLGKIGQRNLPIFFNSPGGELLPSISVGQILRARRMTAGVGHTIPDGCGEGANKAVCVRLMRSGRDLKSHLQIDKAVCASGCAYALIGASTRLIGPGARFGIHASRVVVSTEHKNESKRIIETIRALAERESYAVLREYVTLAGVDASLIDLAMKTSPDGVRWLTHEDLARYGVIPGRHFETRWFPHSTSDGKYFIIKSVTQVSISNEREYRTTNIAIACSPKSSAFVTLRRELDAQHINRVPVARLTSGSGLALTFKPGSRDGGETELTALPVTGPALARVAASGGIVFREEQESWSREVRLSTEGLREALRAAPASCGVRRG